MSRCFIFGIAGFVGSHLCDALKAAGNYVEGMDIKKADNSSADYCHLREANGYLSGKGESWDYVFHCAGPAGPANIKPGYAIGTIPELTRIGLDFASQCGARFVKFSSSEVYGRSDVPLTEETPCSISPSYDARSEYQIGFIAAEQICFSHPHPDVQILRLFNVVGPRQRAENGVVLPRFCRQALKGEPLTIFGDGRQRRAFMDVSDLCSFCLNLMEKWPEKKGIWNVANPGNVFTILELAHLICDAVTGIAHSVAEHDAGLHYRDSAEKHDISIEKALSLDWSPQVSLGEIIDRTLAWHKEQMEQHATR